MSQTEENPDENSVFPFLINTLTDVGGQKHFCQSLITNLFERGSNPCKAEFQELKIKRQLIDH